VRRGWHFDIRIPKCGDRFSLSNIGMQDLLGYFAGALTTFALFPQAIQALKTRSTKDISLAMWAVLCGGIFSWLVYGLQLRSGPLIITNTVSLIVACTVLVLKIRHG
jgi:MtN3 and saliva related transmembrane protein